MMVAEALPMCTPELASWSPDALVERLDTLCLRASLPTLDTSDPALAAELEAICAAGLAEVAFLGALCAVVARYTAGPILAYGPWAGSAIFAHCRAVLGSPHPDAPPDAHEQGRRQASHASFLRRLADAEQPRFLVATLQDDAFLEALDRERAALGMPPALAQPIHGGLRVAPALGPQPERGASPACVDLIVSTLWRAILLLGELRQRVDGVEVDPLLLRAGAPDAAAILDSPLGAMLPEMPPWAASLPAAVDPPSLQAAWLRACPAELPPPAAEALQSRALLAWQFAALAAPHPALAWLALITALEGTERSRIQAAATAAGVSPCEAAEAMDGQTTAPIVREWCAAHGLDPTLPLDPTEDERVLQYGGVSLRAVSTGVPAGAASPIVRLGRVDEPGNPDGTWVACVVGGTSFEVSSGLAHGRALCRVEVAIDLSGERDPDLDLIDRVRDILREHAGPVPVRLLLRRPSARKAMDRQGLPGVAWSPQLAQALEAVAGASCATLRPLAE